jgi:hypothetical protein
MAGICSRWVIGTLEKERGVLKVKEVEGGRIIRMEPRMPLQMKQDAVVGSRGIPEDEEEAARTLRRAAAQK